MKTRKNKHRTSNAQRSTPKSYAKATIPESRELPRETREEVMRHVKRARVLSIREGDVIVVTVPEYRYKQSEKRIHGVMKGMFPGTKVIVKGDEISMQVMRKKIK